MSFKESEPPETETASSRAGLALFWLCVTILVLVPLAFSTAVYRIYVLPKFGILLLGSAAVLFGLGLLLSYDSRGGRFNMLKSNHVALAVLYLAACAVSTLFGAAPLASFFGSFQNEMGLITRFCFFISFIGLIVAIGRNAPQLVIAVWAIALTGLIIAAYSFIQFFGWDPFLPLSTYTTRSPSGPIVRAFGTLGHSNYLGNFLLYTTPLSAALAVASRGRMRRISSVGVVLSIGAIVFSGTRGAWIGVVAGAATFALLGVKPGNVKKAQVSRRRILEVGVVCVIVLISAFVIVSNPASRSVSRRARSFAEDRFTGSGRLLLWRDAIRMVPAFALTGCGPEAFSKTFLAYKSFDSAVNAPQINNESSHNSYLDAAISFGLPGAITYAALIASALVIMFKSRRRTRDRQLRLIITGLMSSVAAVVAHNFFIYDQVPTGLYFYTFMALALVASNVTRAVKPPCMPKDRSDCKSTHLRLAGRALAVLGLVLIGTTLWFVVSLARADVALKRAFASAMARDFDSLMIEGERATRSLEPTDAYSFEFARALALYADSVPRSGPEAGVRDDNRTMLGGLRQRAIQTATDYAEKSLAHSLAPDASYLLAAYLALAEGDTVKLRESASSAISWDPNYFGAHWLMAEALLADGDRVGAIREAEFALRLQPRSSEARSVLARARGEPAFASTRIQGLVERARLALQKGKIDRAERFLEAAIRDSGGPCPACHQALALTYEKARRNEDAITEWQAFTREAPDQAGAQQIALRIESLKRE